MTEYPTASDLSSHISILSTIYRHVRNMMEFTCAAPAALKTLATIQDRIAQLTGTPSTMHYSLSPPTHSGCVCSIYKMNCSHPPKSYRQSFQTCDLHPSEEQGEVVQENMTVRRFPSNFHIILTLEMYHRSFMDAQL